MFFKNSLSIFPPNFFINISSKLTIADKLPKNINFYF
nr:MAG TPA: hypothetical protein [Caudoviricetes sp.]